MEHSGASVLSYTDTSICIHTSMDATLLLAYSALSGRLASRVNVLRVWKR